jgi:hypothetical protein
VWRIGGGAGQNDPLYVWPTICHHRENFCLMRTFAAIVLWFILLVLCWPLALVMLILFPFIWLLLLPFRIVGLTIELVFKFVGAILMFPFRILQRS